MIVIFSFLFGGGGVVVVVKNLLFLSGGLHLLDTASAFDTIAMFIFVD